MRYIAAVLMLLILATSSTLSAKDNSGAAPSILSIIPGQTQPGNSVVISGAGFNSESTLFLGIKEIPFQTVSDQQLSFELPQIPAGNYALYIRNKNGEASKAYSFTVTPVKPSVSALYPETVPLCSAGGERQVLVKGKHFLEGARLLFDGAMIKGSRLSAEEMSFQTPQVPGGLHQVQVKNPEETVSSAIALLITSQPEILAVRQGNDYVNFYELNIEGINFQHGSKLIVDGRTIQSGVPNPGDRDRLVFINCNSLTYQRYPHDPSVKSFQLVIVNPNGEESSLFTVSAP
jgi:hypothetical protein